MRARILLLALAGLLAAGLAMAKPSKPAPTLRGTQTSADAAPVPAPKGPPPPVPLAMPATFTPIPPSTQADIDQCRMACAHTYYFCSAGSDTDDCSSGWTSCRVACVNPPVQTDTQPLPGVR